ncbi:MAG: hypothetical protein A3G43_13745 [Ignavibacteria bacterium RIFCSPLOWO2_12_FULL_56_21]|nr:MAG: hypothetical protein A3G43_13745 [Ignavibacteria bacterium RIFCSPLOWO2_12_FULL_56_21]
MESFRLKHDPIVGPQPQARDPIERWIPFAVRCGAIALADLLLYQAASATWSFPPGRFPFLLSQWNWWIVTSIHEAGHYLFFMFGRIMMIAGGSFWQVAMPLALVGVAGKQRSFWASVYLIIAGVHLTVLNPYIYDAPYRSLPLLGGDKRGHDWYNLLIHWQALDAAEDLAMVAYFGGIFLGVMGTLIGLAWALTLALSKQSK